MSLFCTTLALWLTSFPIIWDCLYVITMKILSFILCAFPLHRSVIRCLFLISIKVMLLAIWQCMDRDHNQAWNSNIFLLQNNSEEMGWGIFVLQYGLTGFSAACHMLGCWVFETHDEFWSFVDTACFWPKLALGCNMCCPLASGTEAAAFPQCHKWPWKQPGSLWRERWYLIIKHCCTVLCGEWFQRDGKRVPGILIFCRD